MKEDLKQKIKKILGDKVFWEIEGDTLFIENNGLKSEIYEDDLDYDFDRCINFILKEVQE